MEIVAISSLSPSAPLPPESGFKAVVSLLWPYSSSTSQCALLLADPDARQRYHKGQVRVRFTGPSAHAIATSGIGIGDTIEVALTGAQWLTEALVHTPGKSVDGELVFKGRLHVSIQRDNGEKKVVDVTESVQPESSKPSMLPPSTPAARIPIRRSMDSYGVAVYSSPAFMKRLRLSEASYSPVTVSEDDDLDTTAARKRRRVSYKNVVEWKFDTREPSPEKGDQDIADAAVEEASAETPAANDTASVQTSGNTETSQHQNQDMEDVAGGQEEDEVATEKTGLAQAQEPETESGKDDNAHKTTEDVDTSLTNKSTEAHELSNLDTTQSQAEISTQESTSMPSAQVVGSQLSEQWESAVAEPVKSTSNDTGLLSLPRLDIPETDPGLQQVLLTNEAGEPITPVLRPVAAENMPLPSPFPTSAHKIPSPSFAEAIAIAGVSHGQVIEAVQSADQESSLEKAVEAVEPSYKTLDVSQSVPNEADEDTSKPASKSPRIVQDTYQASGDEEYDPSSSDEEPNEEVESDSENRSRSEQEWQSNNASNEEMEPEVEEIDADMSSEAHYDDEEIAELQESDDDENAEEPDWEYLENQLADDEMEVAISKASPTTRRQMAASSLRDTLRAHDKTRMTPLMGLIHDNDTDLEDDIAERSDDDSGEDEFGYGAASQNVDDTILPETEENSSDELSDDGSPSYQPSTMNVTMNEHPFGFDGADFSRDVGTAQPESPENEGSAGDETAAWAERDAALNALNQDAKPVVQRQELPPVSTDNIPPPSSRLTIIELSSESESEPETEHEMEAPEDKRVLPEEVQESQKQTFSTEESESSSDQDESEEGQSEADESSQEVSPDEDAPETDQYSSQEDQDSDMIMAKAVSPEITTEEKIELEDERRAVAQVMNHDEDSADFNYVWSPQPSPVPDQAAIPEVEAEPVSPARLVAEQYEIEDEKNAVAEFMEGTDAPAEVTAIESADNNVVDTSMAEAASPGKLVEEQLELEHEKQSVADFMTGSNTSADAPLALSQEEQQQYASPQVEAQKPSMAEPIPSIESGEEDHQEISHPAEDDEDMANDDESKSYVIDEQLYEKQQPIIHVGSSVEPEPQRFEEDHLTANDVVELEGTPTKAVITVDVEEGLETPRSSQAELPEHEASVPNHSNHAQVSRLFTDTNFRTLSRSPEPIRPSPSQGSLIQEIDLSQVEPSPKPAPTLSQALRDLERDEVPDSVDEELSEILPSSSQLSSRPASPLPQSVPASQALPRENFVQPSQELGSTFTQMTPLKRAEQSLFGFLPKPPVVSLEMGNGSDQMTPLKKAEQSLFGFKPRISDAQKVTQSSFDIEQLRPKPVEDLQIGLDDELLADYVQVSPRHDAQTVSNVADKEDEVMRDVSVVEAAPSFAQKVPEHESSTEQVSVIDPSLLEDEEEAPSDSMLQEPTPRELEEVSSESSFQSQVNESPIETQQTTTPLQEPQAEESQIEETQRFQTQITIDTTHRPSSSWRHSLTNKMTSWFSPTKQAQSERKASSTLPESQSPSTTRSKGKERARSISPPPTSRYSQGHTTNLSYFTPLTDLPASLNQKDQTVDIVAVCHSATSEPKQAKTGPRDWSTTLRVIDQETFPQTSQLPSDVVVSAEEEEASEPHHHHGKGIRITVFRPWKASLPSASPGDIVLLRSFLVKSRDREIHLVSTGQSAWCVWKWPSDTITTTTTAKGTVTTTLDYNDRDGEVEQGMGNLGDSMVREEIKGPPVEIGDDERRRVGEVRGWWESIRDEKEE